MLLELLREHFRNQKKTTRWKHYWNTAW